MLMSVELPATDARIHSALQIAQARIMAGSRQEVCRTKLAEVAQPEAAFWRGGHAVAGHVHKAAAAVALQQVIEVGLLFLAAHTAMCNASLVDSEDCSVSLRPCGSFSILKGAHPDIQQVIMPEDVSQS